MNPCPCGNYGSKTKQCRCSPVEIRRYLNRVSGPLFDRIDLHVEVSPVLYEELSSDIPAESSSEILKRVLAARTRQHARFAQTGVLCNAHLPSHALRQVCRLDSKASATLRTAFDKLGLSARAYDRILKVSRTIADLAASETITTAHLAEALQYRTLDRKYWYDK